MPFPELLFLISKDIMKKTIINYIGYVHTYLKLFQEKTSRKTTCVIIGF